MKLATASGERESSTFVAKMIGREYFTQVAKMGSA
jgi:hypothetical protein